MQQFKHQILITYSESDQQYVARVLTVPDCVGYGWNYAAALAEAEHSLVRRLEENKDQASLVEFAPRATNKPQGARRRTLRILRGKHGDLKLWHLCKQFGNGCMVDAFTAALAGNGTRDTRVSIALAADLPPSQLWPQRAFTTRCRDDQEYLRQKPNLPDHSVSGNLPVSTLV